MHVRPFKTNVCASKHAVSHTLSVGLGLSKLYCYIDEKTTVVHSGSYKVKIPSVIIYSFSQNVARFCLARTGSHHYFTMFPSFPNAPVFFMADVSELRMELIFPRSTFARLTPRGLVDVLGVVVEVGVTGVAVAAELDLEAFVGVVGGFDTASSFVVLATAGDALSFLSSDREDNSKAVIHFSYMIDNNETGIDIFYTVKPSNPTRHNFCNH